MSKIELQQGDCIKLMQSLKPKSIDLIFADPPYNLSGENYLTTKNGKVAKLHKGDWDVITDIHLFNETWIKECSRVLSDTGTIWISGTLHNHPSIGVILKKLGFWILNDVIWYKRNATPLLSTNRLAPSTELIWVASKTKKYFFNYELAKQINGGKQMKNLWEINAERHKTTHPTEKPEILLERILLIASKRNDTVLDPFMGSGTTGVVAKRLKRNFIGYEIDSKYFEIASLRIGVEETIKKFANYLDQIKTDTPQLKFICEKKEKYKVKTQRKRNQRVYSNKA